MRFRIPLLVCFWLYHSGGVAAVYDDSVLNAKWVHIQQVSAEWQKTVQTHGEKGRSLIEKAASDQLREAWNRYFVFHRATHNLKTEDYPTPDALVDYFMQQHQSEPLARFIENAGLEWFSLVQRHHQLASLHNQPHFFQTLMANYPLCGLAVFFCFPASQCLLPPEDAIHI